MNTKQIFPIAVTVILTSMVSAATYEDDFSSPALNYADDPLAYSDVSSAAVPTDLNWWIRNPAGNTWKISPTNGNDHAWATKNNYSQGNSSAIFAVIKNDGSLTNTHYLSYDLNYSKGNFAMRVWGIDNSTTWSNDFKWSGGSGAFGPASCLNYGGMGAANADATPLINLESRVGDYAASASWQRFTHELDFGTEYDWIVIGFAQGSTSDETDPDVGIDNFRLSDSPLLPPFDVSVIAGDTELDVAWAGDVAAESYSLYRSLVPSNYTSLATGLTTNTFNDTGLDNGTMYYYVVTSVSNGIESAFSPGGSGIPVPGDDVTPPDAPTGLTATISKHWKVDVSWAANSEGDLDAAPYNLYRSAISGAGYEVVVSNYAGTSYVDADIVEGTNYYYVLTASDLVGNESDFSDEAEAVGIINPNLGDINWGSNQGYEDLDNNGANGFPNAAQYVFQVADATDPNTRYDVVLQINATRDGLPKGLRETWNAIGINGNQIGTNDVLTLALQGVYERSTTGLANSGIRVADQPVSSNAVEVANATLSLISWSAVGADPLTNSVASGTEFSWSGTQGYISGLDAVEFRVMLSDATGFELWSGEWGVTLGSETDDYDNDGVLNLAEYGLNGNPTNGVDDTETELLSDGGLVYIHAQRNDDANVVYSVETTDSIAFPAWADTGYTTVLGTNMTAGAYDYVTNAVPTTDTQKFIRVKIGN